MFGRVFFSRVSNGPPMRRFEQLWGAWDGRVAAGESPADFIPNLPEEDVIGLLAAAPTDRRVERDVLATEALNRAGRARRVMVEVASEVSGDLARLRQRVAEGIARAAREDTGTGEAHEIRRLVREQALQHVQVGGAMASLERAAQRLAALRDESLALTRYPERYFVA